MPRLLEYAVLSFLVVFFFLSVRSIGVMQLAQKGTKPIRLLREKFKIFENVWPNADARTRHAKEALHQLRLIGPKLVLAIGIFALGYLWRDHQLASRQVTYTAVYVGEKLDDKHFVMQPARMKSLDTILCSESVVDWKQGETLEDWTFEQKAGCKRVIMYHRYPQGELNATNAL